MVDMITNTNQIKKNTVTVTGDIRASQWRAGYEGYL